LMASSRRRRWPVMARPSGGRPTGRCRRAAGRW
jgi:hypothetical protein